MLENLTTIAIIASILWMGLIGFYVYSSRQQKDIQKDIEALEALLNKE
jgi:hypothetical protein